MTTMEPSSYFRLLDEALSRIEFTESGGKPISLDMGFERIETLLSKHSAGIGEQMPDARGKVLLIGNGGSAAIASHIHNDLCKNLGIRALTFNETPLLTALSNDIEYDAAFERNAELWSEAGDLVIAISSSGRSENILRAVNASVANGGCVVTLSGFQPHNPLRRLGEINAYVPSESYGHVEIAHLALLHCVADRLAARRSEQNGVDWNKAVKRGANGSR